MEWGWGRRIWRAVITVVSRSLLVAAGALALGGCMLDGQTDLSAAQPRGATVSFESIDGLPQAQFTALVQKLNDEAQARRLAVMSRDNPSAYRVRGYIAAKVVKGKTTIAWVWDVFDGDEHRALRITGEATADIHAHDAWAAADDAMLRRIAQTSMDQLAAFLTSPEAAPGTPVAGVDPQYVLVGGAPSPESEGIYRMPNADPVPTAETPDDAVPLPRRRPPAAATLVSSRDSLILAANSQ